MNILLLSIIFLAFVALYAKVQILTEQVQDLNFEAQKIQEDLYDLGKNE